MSAEFDAGYGDQPFKSLVENYPDETVYPPSDFRVEWGPIFHRGRLDRSAVVLVLGQDPATHEVIARRALIGVAGQRTQGFLAKLGINQSYVMINTFVYGVYTQGGGERHRNDPQIAAYRSLWLDALLIGTSVQAVVALGSLADSAWRAYRMTPKGQSLDVAYQHIPHPTYPESSSGGDATKRESATRWMLAQWNRALVSLRNEITRRDVNTPLVPYGDSFTKGDLAEIPARDMPAGLPAWMRGSDRWASRIGADPRTRRATLKVQVPDAFLPGAGISPDVGRSVSPTRPEPEVDPAPAGRLSLRGQVVTMNAARAVMADAVVYIERGVIIAVQPPTEAKPAGFSEVATLDTGGTIYPGLIELHNHLPYNVLRLWAVPKKFTDRNVWRRSKEYHEAVVAPMSVLARERALAPYIARYVECKALLGGVTTSQGITLINSGVTSKFRGLVRNVEQTDEDALPEASTNVSDVEDMKGGLTELSQKLARAEARGGCLLHHLSEGTDDKARAHFTALMRPSGEWALSPAMVGIHGSALHADDLEVMARHGAAIVWSPLSNLLLYGQTAKIKQAMAHGVRVALGSDWSPSGSKNLLGELKAARAISDVSNFGLSDQALVEMATTTAASMVRWDKQLGSIEPGKKADLLVLAGAVDSAANVYGKLVRARESEIELVVINGVLRFGTPKLMEGADGLMEETAVGGELRVLNRQNPPGSQFPDVTLADATAKLREALNNLPALAKEQETNAADPTGRSMATAELEAWDGFHIELDELSQTPQSTLHRVEAKPASQTVEPLTLDPLTAVDDADFRTTLAGEMNLPPDFKAALDALY